MPKPLIKLFLDSGAYSAWTHEENLSVRDYIRFIKDCQEFVDTYVNLDVIPGTISRVRTSEDVAKSAAASYRNLQIMKDAGLNPLPVFHQGEDYVWLEKLLRDGEEIIGISSAKNQPNIVQERWNDQFWSIVTNSRGEPLVKVHGFGVAHVDILKRHPYYSIDSAGWRIAAAYGKMYYPQRKHSTLPWDPPEYDYSQTPELVTMTGNYAESPHSQERQHTHEAYHGRYIHVPALDEWLRTELGVTSKMAQYSDRVRYRALAFYYQKVADTIGNIRFHTPAIRWLDRETEKDKEQEKVHHMLERRRSVRIPRLKFVFSTAYDLDNCAALVEAKAYNHLLSYYELKNRPEVLEGYAMEGKVLTRPPIKRKPSFKDRRYITRRRFRIAKLAYEYEKEKSNGAAGTHQQVGDSSPSSRDKQARSNIDALLVHRPRISRSQRPDRD